MADVKIENSSSATKIALRNVIHGTRRLTVGVAGKYTTIQDAVDAAMALPQMAETQATGTATRITDSPVLVGNAVVEAEFIGASQRIEFVAVSSDTTRKWYPFLGFNDDNSGIICGCDQQEGIAAGLDIYKAYPIMTEIVILDSSVNSEQVIITPITDGTACLHFSCDTSSDIAPSFSCTNVSDGILRFTGFRNYGRGANGTPFIYDLDVGFEHVCKYEIDNCIHKGANADFGTVLACGSVDITNSIIWSRFDGAFFRVQGSATMRVAQSHLKTGYGTGTSTIGSEVHGCIKSPFIGKANAHDSLLEVTHCTLESIPFTRGLGTATVRQALVSEILGDTTSDHNIILSHCRLLFSTEGYGSADAALQILKSSIFDADVAVGTTTLGNATWKIQQSSIEVYDKAGIIDISLLNYVNYEAVNIANNLILGLIDSTLLPDMAIDDSDLHVQNNSTAVNPLTFTPTGTTVDLSGVMLSANTLITINTSSATGNVTVSGRPKGRGRFNIKHLANGTARDITFNAVDYDVGSTIPVGVLSNEQYAISLITFDFGFKPLIDSVSNVI